MYLSGLEYRDSLRRYKPTVFVNGRRVEAVADEPLLAPGIAGVALTYDFARREELAPWMRATVDGATVNRMIAVPRDAGALLDKLEAVRLVGRETGCAQRYLGGDGLAAVYQATHRLDEDLGGDYHPRLLDYLRHVYARDLTLGLAMTDAKGDRSLRPHAQPNPDAYLRIVGRDAGGIRVSGVKAIVTGAPYVHELLVMPGRAMTDADRDFAVCCALPVDAPGLTIVARPAGRPGESAAPFSAKYGQSTGVCLFDNVFVPWERVFLAGEWTHSEHFTACYATHHRHTCIGARAGFGDLLIGAGALMIEANGLDPERAPALRESMVELIKIVEGFYACGVAASVYAEVDGSGIALPEPVFANVGKLLLATQIYDMHRLAHEVSGGLVVALPGPDEDHNPATAGRISEVLAARSEIPYARRIEVARLIEDLTASYQGGWYSVISLHGGGSPEAMKREIYRRYPIEERVALVERLLDRGAHFSGDPRWFGRQPGRCCLAGCRGSELAGPPVKNAPTDGLS